MHEDHIDYPYLIDQAMRGVVREVLRKVQTSGLPADHHFFISFATNHPDVKMSEQLRAKYPSEITIVMQHQFWDLKVDDKGFGVSMSFGGVPEKLAVPFSALTGFADPSIKFGLQFQSIDEFDDEEDAAIFAPSYFEEIAPAKSGTTAGTTPDEGSGEKIISLDAFRKK